MRYLTNFIFFASLLLLISFHAKANSNARIAIYTGSFDPPTFAHKQLIVESIQRLNLNKLYIMVNTYSDEKNYKTSADERVYMVKTMLDEYKDKIIILKQNSYNKGRDLQFIRSITNEPMIQITGEDSYLKMQKIKSQRINFEKIIVIKRPINCMTNKVVDTPVLEKHAEFMNLKNSHNLVCSGKVREKLAKREYDNIPISDDVLKYIQTHDLYAVKSAEALKTLREEYQKVVEEFVVNLNITDHSHDAPELNPAESKASWNEKLLKWYHKDIINNYFKTN